MLPTDQEGLGWEQHAGQRGAPAGRPVTWPPPYAGCKLQARYTGAPNGFSQRSVDPVLPQLQSAHIAAHVPPPNLNSPGACPPRVGAMRPGEQL
jgi:hypothetical protein